MRCGTRFWGECLARAIHHHMICLVGNFLELGKLSALAGTSLCRQLKLPDAGSSSLRAAVECLTVERSLAQQPDPSKSSGAAPNQTTSDANSSDSAAKAKIVASPAWKQINDEFQKWLASQAIYTPADVERIKANLKAQIQAMPASELQGFLDDWQAKLKVLNGKDFQDAQQWLGEYLSVLTDGFRRRTLKDLGLDNVANMTARQLEDAIVRIRANRLATQQRQAAFEQSRQQMVRMVQQTNASAQQAQQQTNAGAARFGTNQTPDRPPKFNPPPPPRRQFYLDSDGRIRFALPF